VTPFPVRYQLVKLGVTNLGVTNLLKHSLHIGLHVPSVLVVPHECMGKRLVTRGQVGDAVVFELLFVSPTSGEGW
jgi:hypothetical protein